MKKKRIRNRMFLQYAPNEMQNNNDEYRQALKDVLKFSRKKRLLSSFHKIKDLKELERVTLMTLEKLDKKDNKETERKN